jgi:predicted MPP superfamily phosphohydrolase
MPLFLITFFLLYGGMHLYAFLKARNILTLNIPACVLLMVFMLTMTIAPLIIRISEKHGFELFARLMSYTGYTWMGLILLFFVCSVAIDVFRLSVYLAGFVFKSNFYFLKPSARLSFFMALILSVSFAIYGYFEAWDIRTEKITIKTPKLPEQIGRLRVVQISDVHIGLIVREKKLKRVLREVKMANPDILVSTGDLVDGQIDSLKGLSELFQEINPRYGKFAITGNHEFYAGLDQSLEFTEKAGFTILRGEGLTVGGLINIAGVDDPAGKADGLLKSISEEELLSKFPREKFTILLKHRALVNENSLGLFDLQLSGHTHKGQIFPFRLITRLYYPVDAGLLKLMDNSHLYVSRGSGTWGPPIRFLAPPEVTVIELVHKK